MKSTSWGAAASVVALFIFGNQAMAGAEEGRAKAQVCAACHGPGGNLVNPEVPLLAG